MQLALIAKIPIKFMRKIYGENSKTQRTFNSWWFGCHLFSELHNFYCNLLHSDWSISSKAGCLKTANSSHFLAEADQVWTSYIVSLNTQMNADFVCPHNDKNVFTYIVTKLGYLFSWCPLIPWIRFRGHQLNE